MRTLIIGLSLIATAAFISACGRGSYNQAFVDACAVPTCNMKIAVLPFENLTTHRNAGIICSELLTTELYRQRIFDIVEQSRVRKWMSDNKINPSQMTETTFAQAVARALNVQAVLIGSVSEFGYQHGLKEEPTVGINVRLVNAANARVMWAASNSDVGRGIFNRDCANETAQRVVVRMVSELKRRIR